MAACVLQTVAGIARGAHSGLIHASGAVRIAGHAFRTERGVFVALCHLGYLEHVTGSADFADATINTDRTSRVAWLAHARTLIEPFDALLTA